MPIRSWWERVVTTWKTFRPARRRRRSISISGETFEPRRLLSAFFVNSLVDSHDLIPGDGIAADANGFTTLRAALEEANANFGADTITLPAGVVSLSAANGPLVVTDEITILGNSASEIDGTAFDEVFAVNGAGRLQLDHVSVVSSGPLAASLRPMLLTTNARQADLIVAFSASPTSALTIETKASSGLSLLSAMTAPDREFDASLTTATATAKLAKSELQAPDFGDFVVPTPEEAINQIINALFRNEPDFVLPVGAEQKPGALSEDNAKPLPKPGPVEDSSQEEGPKSGDEQSLVDPVDDEAVRTVLRSWASDAGWSEFSRSWRVRC
ncbi:MAG: putative extracellular nuclease [Planctomycetota bacterium]|nr:MAG: putative extracellular nuclease [Planctomycetota bacterium]